MGNRNNDIYFAELQGLEYLDALADKVNTYRDYCGSTGQRARWELSLGSYYGVSPDAKNSWRVTPGGEFGELAQFKVNDFASLLRHELILAVQQRPAGIAKAINSDVTTLRNARIGTQLVEYYLTDPAHEFEKDYIAALALACDTAEAFVVQDWDVFMGDPIRPDEFGEPIYSGDIIQEVFPTWNAARDLGAPSPDQPWYIFSKRYNKFELAARYPAYREEILLQAQQGQSQIRKPLIFRPNTDGTDFIEMHKLLHIPTPACKQGRYTLFIDGTVIFDGPFPYPKKNFFRISEEDMIETPFAHTSNYDLLALEQVTDTLHSIVLNNQATFGVSTIVGPKGGGISHTELAKGLRYIELDPQLVDKIRPLQLTATPKEVFEYIAMLGTKKGEMSGINSIVRGDPQGALKGASGSAMALLQSQAITINSGKQKAFYSLLSRAGTGIIEMMRKYADEPRVVKIAGKANAQAIKEFKFTTETLNSVSTVVFEPVSPLLQTASGRLTVADNLLQQGLLTNPKRYIEVLTTGNLSVLLQDQVAMEEAIIEENEKLAEGEFVEAVIVENHQEHINGHQSVIAMPNTKRDPQVVANVLAHIQQHLNLWRQASDTNPALLAATGQQVLPPMPPPGGGLALPPGGGPTPQPSPGGSAAVGNPQAQEAKQPSLPNPPQNPATGEPAELAPGTAIQ
jgi:hypothetical protein